MAAAGDGGPGRAGRPARGSSVVLVAGKHPYTERGGHSSYVRAHARALRDAGYGVRLACLAPDSGREETAVGTIDRQATPWRPFSPVMLPVHAPRLIRSLVTRLAAERGPHLLHAFGGWAWVAVAAAARLARRGVEAVPVASAYTTMLHESRGKVQGLSRQAGHPGWLRQRLEVAWFRGVVSRYEGRAYREARLVLVNYESVRRLIRAEYGPGIRIRQVPFAAESAWLAASSARSGAPGEAPGETRPSGPAGAPVLVAVSRHDHRKGLDVLLRALALLRTDGVAFRAVLVGGGKLEAAHRRYAERLGLGPVVTIAGWVPDPGPYLREADVFVLPSIEEGSGSVALVEALQAGLPVVASAVDGIPEDVTDNESALLVPPASDVALAVALRRLLEDQGLRARLARGARAIHQARFSPAGLTRVLAGIYGELGFPAPAGSGPSPPPQRPVSRATSGAAAARL